MLSQKTSAIIIATFIFSVFVAPVFGAVDTKHVGFVDSSLWFDREPFFSGENLRIYTTLANSSSADFKASVEFYDGNAVIGSAEVTLERNGGFQVVWVDWTPKEGDHTVSVKITNATLTQPGEESKSVEYGNSKTYTLSRFVDTDTDNDGIGNTEDTDDDNDGIPDKEDTEPLIAYIEQENKTDQAEGSSIKKDLEDKSTQIVSKVGEFASSTSPKIIAGVNDTVNTIEKFRKEQSKNINEKIKETKEKIKNEKENLEDGYLDETEEVKKSAPFNQLQLLALTVAGYTLSNKIAFYITGVFILYFLLRKIIPWIYRLIRGRREEY